MDPIRPARLLFATLVSTLALAACVVVPAPRRVVYAEPGPSVAIVDVPPPAPYVEVVPAVPFEGAVWIGGYWGWGGGRHVWVPGHYERGRPGYAWRPHAWVQEGGRWHLHEGGWARR